MYDKKRYDARLIILYKGDFARLAKIHPHSKPTIVIRELVRRHLNDSDEQFNALLEHIDSER